ncbi:MAG: prolyl oligopeptidase family serine peptidase [Ignavibacteriaceae bacterium]|nr:prolyl oligopeptidase family serine peptidase [Ignavibacteriaceae bacterium]
MTTNIIEREIIDLPQTNLNILKSAWGSESIDDSIVEKVVYLSHGIRVRGYIAYPKFKKENEKFPCLLWNRGGFEKRGAIDSYTARGMFGQIAAWGYVVFASQYRGNFEGEGVDEFGGADLIDIVNMTHTASEFPFADTEKWGIEGWSRGGMMSYLILSKYNFFKTALITGGITDLKEAYNAVDTIKRGVDNLTNFANLEEFLYSRSIINFYEKLPVDIPYLIIHGSKDDVINPSQSLRLTEKMIKSGYSVRLLMLEDSDHYIKQRKKEGDLMRKEWLKKYLV